MRHNQNENILAIFAGKQEELMAKLGNIIEEEVAKSAKPDENTKSDLEIIQEVSEKYDFPTEPQA
jgi:hypothetical protein